MEQLQPQQIFQTANLMAERCRRDVQLLGRLGEAGVARGGFEGSERVQGRQGTAHLIPEVISSIGRDIVVCARV